MPAPHASQHDDQQLTLFLLGALPADETERIDELSIVDNDIAGRLRAVEHDLVDAYVRGTLSDDLRRRFEAVYLTTSAGRGKVTFARNFLPAAERSATSAPAPPVARTWPVGWGLAAAAVILTAGGAFTVGELRLRHALADAREAGTAVEQRAHLLERELEQQRTKDADTIRELERLRAELGERAQRLPSRDLGPDPPSEASSVALVLSPQTRGGTAVATIAVPAGNQGVRFDLQLDANDFPRYEAALEGATSERVLWRSGRIAARIGETPTLSIVVPASVLTPQRHSLQVTGYDATGAAHAIGSYRFGVARR